MNKFDSNSTTNGDDKASLIENLPAEMLNSKRFFPVKIAVDGKKLPTIKAWQEPENQRNYRDVRGLKGFDTCGHGQGVDYLFLDFDHVLGDDGEFLFPEAEQWFNFITGNCAFTARGDNDSDNTFCEISYNGHGLHVFCVPTPNKFSTISNGANDILWIDRDRDAKIEIFYMSAGRYSLMTGNLFRCTAPANIPHGEVADEIFQRLLDELDRINPDRVSEKNLPTQNAEDVDVDDADARAIMTAIFAAVDPNNCDYFEWRDYGFVAKRVGVPFEEFNAWCARDKRINSKGKPLYSLKDCEYFWNKFHTADELGNRGLGIGTAIKHAKRHGYTPPKMSPHKSKRSVTNLPIKLVFPDDVEFQGNSIVLVGKKKKTDSEPPRYTASRTLILPTKKFVSDTSGKVSYEVSIHLPDGTWKRAETDKRTLLDPSRIFELTEQDADVASPKTLTSYFSKLLALPENDALIPKVIVYNRPGWHGDNFIYPIPADGENYRVERSGINYASIFTPKGDAKKWLEKFLVIADSKNQGALKRIVIGACALAPMLEIIGGMNPQFNLWGTSNLAKTPLVKFGLSIYGDPSIGKLMRTWGGSSKNRLTMAAGLGDFPQMLDEAESMSATSRKELSAAVYDFSTGLIKQINKRNGDVHDAEAFRSVRFSTGETPMHTVSDKQGNFKRLIDLPVRKELFPDSEARKLHLFAENNFGHFGRSWIRYIKANKADIAKDFESACDYFAAGGFTRDGLHAEFKSVDPTNARSIIACAVAFWHFYRCVFELPFDYMQARFDAEQILAELPTIDEMSDVKRSIQLLASWVAEHPKSFITPRKYNGTPIEGEDNPAESYAGTVGKKFADGHIAFYPFAFRKICAEIGLPSYEKFLCDLYDADCLECKSSREKSTQKKIEGENKRVYMIKSGVLFSNTTDDD